MTYTASESVTVPWDSKPRLIKVLTSGHGYSDEYTILDHYAELHRKREAIDREMNDLRLIIDKKITIAGELAVLDGEGNCFIHRSEYTRVTLDAKWAERRLVELGEKSGELEKHKKKTVVKGGLTFKPAKRDENEGEDS